MPDEAIGCIAGIFRFTGEIIVEFFLEIICGHLGHYTVRLLTFGKIHLEPDSIAAIVSGFLTLLVTGYLIWLAVT